MPLTELPPQGTKCRVCGCCNAGVYDLSGGVRVPVCMACDQGVPCAGELAREAALEAGPPAAPKDDSKQSEAQASEPKEDAMPIESMDGLCAKGCGKRFRHVGKCAKGAGGGQAAKKKKSPSTALAKIEPQLEIEAPETGAEAETVWLQLNAAQVDRLWAPLTLEQKATGILGALSVEQE